MQRRGGMNVLGGRKEQRGGQCGRAEAAGGGAARRAGTEMEEGTPGRLGNPQKDADSTERNGVTLESL